MLRERFFKRQWYVEEFRDGNPLHLIHKQLGLVYKTRSEVEDEIIKKIKVEGGELLKGSKVRR